MDKQSVGMQSWLTWKEAQVPLDRESDLEAIGRLSHIDPRDAMGLVSAMSEFLTKAEPVKPLSAYEVGTWEERIRYHYWPAAAESFASLTGLELPNLMDNFQRNDKWATAAEAFLTDAPEGLIGRWPWPVSRCGRRGFPWASAWTSGGRCRGH